MERRILLAQCENLLMAAKLIEPSEDFGPSGEQRLNQIKSKIEDFVENINNLRTKVKADKSDKT